MAEQDNQGRLDRLVPLRKLKEWSALLEELKGDLGKARTNRRKDNYEQDDWASIEQ